MLLRVARIEGKRQLKYNGHSVPRTSDGASSADQVNDENNQRHHQQQVDETPSYVEREAQKPENQKKRHNRPSNPHCHDLQKQTLCTNISCELNRWQPGQQSNALPIW